MEKGGNKNAERCEKRSAGYIHNLTPTKRCASGDVSYRFSLQDSESSQTSVLGFGGSCHKKLTEYMESQSPVKMRLKYNPNYKTCVLNENSNVETGKNVDFDYTPSTEDPFIPVSRTVTVDVLNSLCADDQTYYSAIGKLFIGDQPAKIIPNGSVVKEDVFLADKSGKIELHLWAGQFEQLIDSYVYSITHLKARKYKGVLYMTASPFSIFTVSSEEIDVCKEMISFSNEDKITIIEFIDVGEIERFASCRKCKKKVTGIIPGKKIVKCITCKATKRVSDLVQNIYINVTAMVNEVEQMFTITYDVLQSMIPIAENDDDEDIAAKLLELDNITLIYCPKTKFVIGIENALQTEDIGVENTSD